MNLLANYGIIDYWSFIDMILLNKHMCWYETAQSITNKAPPSKGKSPYALNRRLVNGLITPIICEHGFTGAYNII